MVRIPLLLMCLWSWSVLADSKLTSTPSDAWHLLGDSISVSGNTAAIAANGTSQIYIREFQTGGSWVTKKIIGDFGPTTDAIVRLTTDHLAVRTWGQVQIYGRNQGGVDHWGLEGQFTAADQESVAIDGDRLLVGVHQDSVGYRTEEYQWNSDTASWSFEGSFAALPPLALSGNTLVTGLPNAQNSMTSVYIFERDTAGSWTQTATVSSPASINREYFGKAVALDGDWLVVGAPAWFRQGAAYVYQRNRGGTGAWGAVQSLAPVGNAQEFGTSVSISGNRVAVGMEAGDSTVHVFERTGSTYSLKGRFRPGVAYSQNFGRELGLVEDQLIASDLWRNSPNNYAGAIFQFNVTTGNENTISPESRVFLSATESIGDQFGAAVSMDGQTMAIGTPCSDNPMSDCGAVYLYSRRGDGSWELTSTLVPPDAEIQAYFGTAVALQGDTLAVAAPGKRAVYIFDRNTGGPGKWGQLRKQTDCSVDDLSFQGDTLAGTSGWANQVYLFERNAGGANSWVMTSLTGSSGRVSVHGNTLVSSADNSTISTSSAQVATRSAAGATDWHYTASFSTTYPFYYLGASSLEADTVAIAGRDSEPGQSRPREIVSIRRRDQGGANQWGEVARLAPFDRTGSIGYGKDVKLEGNRLLVGAPDDTTDGVAAGSVYVYEGSTDKAAWTFLHKMSASDPLAGDQFGASVETSGDVMVIGAPGHAGAGKGAGAAYLLGATLAPREPDPTDPDDPDPIDPGSPVTLVLGRPVTGQPGAAYASFGTPQPGAQSGSVTASKKTTPALFAADGSVLIGVGDAAPGLPGTVIGKLGSPSGDAALATLRSGPGGVTAKNNIVLLTGLSTSSLRVAARTGTSQNGLPSGVTLKRFGAIDGNGSAIFFLATLQGAGITAKNATALCVASGDGLVRVRAQATQIVGGKAIATIGTLVGGKSSLAEGRWRLNDTTFGVRLTFTDKAKSQGIFSIPAAADDPSGWQEFAVTGPAGSISGLTAESIASFGLPGFGPESFAALAHLTLHPGGATAADNIAMIAGALNGPPKLLRRKNDLIETDADGHLLVDVKIKTFSDPVQGKPGHIAYLVTATGKGFGSGIEYVSDGSDPKVLANVGSAAPGGGRFAAFTSLALPDGEKSGPIFTAKLTVSPANLIDPANRVTAKNNLGLWGVNSAGDLQLLLRTGQEIIAGGTAHTLKSFTALIPPAGAPGTASGYDNQGNIAVYATFADGKRALLRLVVP